MLEVVPLVAWYLVSTVLGLVAFPLTARIFSRLPDRGFGFSRVVGLLAVSYGLWLGASVGLLRNHAATVWGLVLLLGLASAVLTRGRWQELKAWLADNWRTVLTAEGLFLAAFLIWAFVRATSPDIVGTEKPMELAFINSVVHSESFPPFDPWLAGFGISYYYFGFVMVGVLTMLTNTAPGIAFNLTNALWFALALVAAYTLVHNLIAARENELKPAAGLLGPLFVVLVGNLEGFLEVLHARGLFWRQGPGGELASGFWSWLDIKTLVNPPVGGPQWIPDRHWWWWRASRVVRDLNLAGVDHEVIDEFPFFSFLLADNHPHLLALPFVLLAVGFAFQIFLQGPHREVGPLFDLREGQLRQVWLGGCVALGLLFIGGGLAAAQSPSQVMIRGGLILFGFSYLLLLVAGELPSLLPRGTLLVAAWIFGSLAFLNTWDFPLYLSIVFFLLLAQGRSEGWLAQAAGAASTSFGVLLLSVALYLPWYPTFSSQASGILPNIGFPTKFQQFTVMFAPLFVPAAVWLIARSRQQGPIAWRRLLLIGVLLPVGLWLTSWAVAAGAAASAAPLAIQSALDQMGAPNMRSLIEAALERRLMRGGTSLALGFTVALAWLLLETAGMKVAEVPTAATGQGARVAKPWPFVAILAGVGALLVLGPEFFYLQDLFGTRMNTVFKFYFAAWILWGIVAAFASYELWPRRWTGWAPLRTLIYLPLLLGLFYPVMSLATRTGGVNPARTLTLDGTAHLEQVQSGDKRAIDWINANIERGTVAEAVGGSYTQYGRIATHTGLATVLGWEFHEVQWRGSAELQGSRRADIERLYTTGEWRVASEIVKRYGIDYVYIGSLERTSYGNVRENKFEAFMEPIYQEGETVIYATPERAELP